MPDFGNSYNFSNAVQLLTRNNVISNVVVDQVFQSIRLCQWMMGKGRVVDIPGGTALTWLNNVGVSPNTVTYDGADPLPILSMDGNLLNANLPWANYADAFVIAGTDVQMNEGSVEQIGSIVETQLDIVRMSIVNKLASDLINNNPNIDPKGLQGFSGAVDDGTVLPTYAGISRNYIGNSWKSQCNYQLPSTSSFLAELHQLDLKASIDGQRPEAYFINRTGFGAAIESLWAQDQYQQPEMARTVGGTDLVFNGKPLMLDNFMPTGVPTPATFSVGGQNSFGQILGLNPTYLKLAFNPKAKFRTTEWASSQTNYTMFTRILATAQLMVLKPSAHLSLWVQGF
jgi:hypothetical protein